VLTIDQNILHSVFEFLFLVPSFFTPLFGREPAGTFLHHATAVAFAKIQPEE
jgi:hypothetical protein